MFGVSSSKSESSGSFPDDHDAQTCMGLRSFDIYATYERILHNENVRSEAVFISAMF